MTSSCPSDRWDNPEYRDKLKNNLRLMFKFYINPTKLIPFIRKYDPDVLSDEDQKTILTKAFGEGRMPAALELLERITVHSGWFKCVVKALSDEWVNKAYIAEHFVHIEEKLCEHEYNRKTFPSETVSAISLDVAGETDKLCAIWSNQRYVDKLKEALKPVFRFYINPVKLMTLLKVTDPDVLREEDQKAISAKVANEGRMLGALELLERLTSYKGWYRCLLQTLCGVRMGQTVIAEHIVELEEQLSETVDDTEKEYGQRVVIGKERTTSPSRPIAHSLGVPKSASSDLSSVEPVLRDLQRSTRFQEEVTSQLVEMVSSQFGELRTLLVTVQKDQVALRDEIQSLRFFHNYGDTSMQNTGRFGSSGVAWKEGQRDARSTCQCGDSLGEMGNQVCDTLEMQKDGERRSHYGTTELEADREELCTDEREICSCPAVLNAARSPQFERGKLRKDAKNRSPSGPFETGRVDFEELRREEKRSCHCSSVLGAVVSPPFDGKKPQKDVKTRSPYGPADMRKEEPGEILQSVTSWASHDDVEVVDGQMFDRGEQYDGVKSESRGRSKLGQLGRSELAKGEEYGDVRNRFHGPDVVHTQMIEGGEQEEEVHNKSLYDFSELGVLKYTVNEEGGTKGDVNSRSRSLLNDAPAESFQGKNKLDESKETEDFNAHLGAPLGTDRVTGDGVGPRVLGEMRDLKTAVEKAASKLNDLAAKLEETGHYLCWKVQESVAEASLKIADTIKARVERAEAKLDEISSAKDCGTVTESKLDGTTTILETSTTTEAKSKEVPGTKETAARAGVKFEENSSAKNTETSTESTSDEFSTIREVRVKDVAKEGEISTASRVDDQADPQFNRASERVIKQIEMMIGPIGKAARDAVREEGRLFKSRLTRLERRLMDALDKETALITRTINHDNATPRKNYTFEFQVWDFRNRVGSGEHTYSHRWRIDQWGSCIMGNVEFKTDRTAEVWLLHGRHPRWVGLPDCRNGKAVCKVHIVDRSGERPDWLLNKDIWVQKEAAIAYGYKDQGIHFAKGISCQKLLDEGWVAADVLTLKYELSVTD